MNLWDENGPTPNFILVVGIAAIWLIVLAYYTIG